MLYFRRIGESKIYGESIDVDLYSHGNALLVTVKIRITSDPKVTTCTIVIVIQ